MRTRLDLPHVEEDCSNDWDAWAMEREVQGKWLEVEERLPGIFVIVDENITERPPGAPLWEFDLFHKKLLAFAEWDEDVQDLGRPVDDLHGCFGFSNHLCWQDVVITCKWFRAPSIDRLKEALTHVTFRAWCRGDI